MSSNEAQNHSPEEEGSDQQEGGMSSSAMTSHLPHAHLTIAGPQHLQHMQRPHFLNHQHQALHLQMPNHQQQQQAVLHTHSNPPSPSLVNNGYQQSVIQHVPSSNNNNGNIAFNGSSPNLIPMAMLQGLPTSNYIYFLNCPTFHIRLRIYFSWPSPKATLVFSPKLFLPKNISSFQFYN